MPTHANLRALRTAIPYIRAYKGHVFVIKLSGRLCEPGDTLDHLAEQIALLDQLGIQIVVVHGGGPQADALAERINIPARRIAGRRITDDQTLEVVKMAFAGTVSTNLVAAFRKAHVPAVGLSGIDSDLVTATRRPITAVADSGGGAAQDVDFGHVGDITNISGDVLLHLLEAGHVPAIASLAADTDGKILNVNADTVAARVAAEIGAAKYFLVTNVDGVLRDRSDPATLCPYLDLDELHSLTESGAISDGMLPKLAACRSALEAGVPRVHIINGTQPDTLLAEVFTNEGCGTLLVKSRTASKPPASDAPAPEMRTT